MGNAELKNAFKNGSKDTDSKQKLGLTAEILFEDDLVAYVKQAIISEMNVKEIDTSKAFPETNHQVNENEEENFKRQFISELNETFIVGFPTA